MAKPIEEVASVAIMPAPSLTPVELLRIAVTNNADVEKLTKLMDLQERWEKNEARKAFNEAMKRFKANPPEILKNKLVEFDTSKGKTSYRHATLDSVCEIVTKALYDVGITFSWKVSQDKEFITVAAVLTHDLGHSEQTQLMGMPDNSGGKNPIQAVGSTTTYLQRYSLLAACGLAASNDTDGVVRDTKGLDEDKVREYLAQMSEVYTLPELQTVFGKAYKEATAVNDRQAMAAFISAKDTKKKEIQNAAS